MKKYVDLKLIKYLILFYSIIEVVNFVKLLYYKDNGAFENLEIPFFNYVLYNIVLKWIVVILIMIVISYATKSMFDRWGISKKIIWIHLLIAISIGLFIFFIMTFVITLIDQNILFENFWQIYWSEYIQFLDYNFLVYFSMIGVIYVYYYIKRVRHIEKQKSKLEVQLSFVKLKFLQSQIRPHFLFNTLNNIHSLIDIDTKKSKEIIVDLSTILRELLNQENKNLIELQDEISILNKYININKTRFSSQLNFIVEIEDGLENVLVPNMLLQPIIENSIKHGMISKKPLIVNLKVFKTGNKLNVKVSNDGNFIKGKLSDLMEKGTGLRNIIDRLKTLYDSNFTYNMTNTTNGVLTKISIPIKLSISELERE